MLERTNKKSYFEELLYEEFVCITKEDLSTANQRSTRSYTSSRQVNPSLNDNNSCSPNERNMTRKTRTRRPRIQAIQSGYCAICSVPYNSVEEHIQSKKHQKLIGEDANYIALNGYVHPDIGIESLLSLTGIDAIGFDHDFSPKIRRRNNMPRTRASSVVSDLAKLSPLSPTGSDYNGHHLRSRRNINYMTPPLEDDSLQEKPDFEPVRLEYKEYRELRSSTRALAKLTSSNDNDTPESEVWDSGRPKRRCISRRKRSSIDESPINKTYYKVEVMSNKQQSSENSKEKDKDVSRRLRSPKSTSEHEKEKGLIVKFKKLRNTELVQLNNEATNFLFPKKEDTSEEEDDGDLDTDGANTVSSGKNESTIILSSDGEDCKTMEKFKVEDEASMDSTSSDAKRKRKRRTQAEAFIMDNQKYYKFEMPGSRLRYQGSYLSPISIKSPKSNDETTMKNEKEESDDEPKPRKSITNINIEDYQFSFESVPKNQSWYAAFQRQDRGEQHYNVTSNYYWDEFLMPYQMRHLKPLNPKICMSAYSEIMSSVVHNPSKACCSSESPDRNQDLEELDNCIEIHYEDSNASTGSSTSTAEELEMVVESKTRPSRSRLASVTTPGKNPRKSPRQHASTLAILSSLINQRKRRSRNTEPEESQEILPAIPEEEPSEDPPPQPPPEPSKPRTPKKVKKKIDYASIALKIEEELDTALDVTAEELELEISEEEPLFFNESEVRVTDILKLYDEAKSAETELSCRRFFNGTPGRKPGKRTKNKTGWPTKSRRKKVVKEKNSEDNGSSNEDGDSSDEDTNGNETEKEEIPQTTVNIPNVKKPPVRKKKVFVSNEDGDSSDDTNGNETEKEEIPQTTVNVPKIKKPLVRKKKIIGSSNEDGDSSDDDKTGNDTVNVPKVKKPVVRKKKIIPQRNWSRVNNKRVIKKKPEPRRDSGSDSDEDVRTPTKKPLKRKKNKTGWPNVVRKRTSNTNTTKTTMKKVKKPRRLQKNDSDDDEESNQGCSIKVRNCDLNEENNRVSDTRDSKVNIMQPYVYVKKLDANSEGMNVSGRKVRKTSGRRRRIMPGSPKSPRMLRKPRGRWYRER